METQQVEQMGAALVALAPALTVTDHASYEHAATVLLDVKDRRKIIKDYFAPMKQKANDAHKEICRRETEADAPFAEFERMLKSNATTWYKAEQQRQDEIARQAEAAQRKAAEDAALAEAAAAEAAGEHETAEAIVAAPTFVAPVIPQRAAPKIAGIAMRKAWKGECVDLAALVRAIAAGQAPLALVQANAVEINVQARRDGAQCRIPGVRVWEEAIMAAGVR